MEDFLLWNNNKNKNTVTDFHEVKENVKKAIFESEQAGRKAGRKGKMLIFS